MNQHMILCIFEYEVSKIDKISIYFADSESFWNNSDLKFMILLIKWGFWIYSVELRNIMMSACLRGNRGWTNWDNELF